MNDLSIIINRGQKRILNWKREVDANYKLSNSEKSNIIQNLTTLNQLYGKLLSAKDMDKEETVSRIKQIEATIELEYNRMRLLTSPNGTPAIKS